METLNVSKKKAVYRNLKRVSMRALMEEYVPKGFVLRTKRVPCKDGKMRTVCSLPFPEANVGFFSERAAALPLPQSRANAWYDQVVCTISVNEETGQVGATVHLAGLAFGEADTAIGW